MVEIEDVLAGKFDLSSERPLQGEHTVGLFSRDMLSTKDRLNGRECQNCAIRRCYEQDCLLSATSKSRCRVSQNVIM